MRLRLVSERHDVTHVNACLQHFHPLGYAKPFGFFARYLIEAKAGVLGCILVSGATRALFEPQRSPKLTHSCEQKWVSLGER